MEKEIIPMGDKIIIKSLIMENNSEEKKHERAKTKEQVIEEIYRLQITPSNLMLRSMDKWAEIYATQLKEENKVLHDKLQKQINIGVKDYEENQRLREALDRDPYPEKIFIPLTDLELKNVDKVLKVELGFRLDRLSAQIGREILKGLRNSIASEAKQKQ